VIVSLIRLSKSHNSGPRTPLYAASFLIGGKRRLFHAVVHTREANAVSFREPEIEMLLSAHMDQGRLAYQAVSQYHLTGHATLPLRLGNLEALPARRVSRAAVATGG
jgi:hypothetical protein